jgi:hypothetical protein
MIKRQIPLHLFHRARAATFEQMGAPPAFAWDSAAQKMAVWDRFNRT